MLRGSELAKKKKNGKKWERPKDSLVYHYYTVAYVAMKGLRGSRLRQEDESSNVLRIYKAALGDAQCLQPLP